MSSRFSSIHLFRLACRPIEINFSLKWREKGFINELLNWNNNLFPGSALLSWRGFSQVTYLYPYFTLQGQLDGCLTSGHVEVWQRTFILLNAPLVAWTKYGRDLELEDLLCSVRHFVQVLELETSEKRVSMG